MFVFLDRPRSRHSKTAEFMALFRALESARGQKTRLFSDPWASLFLRPSLRIVALLVRLRPLNSAISRFIDRRWPGARASGVARTRYIDDALKEALDDGLSPVVILGAGFDSRAYRIPGVAEGRVFEVDRPDMSLIKQNRLRRALGSLPPHVSFVAVDFRRESLRAAMHAAGLDLRGPIFVIWEGVTNYLTEPAIDAILRHIATAAAGSRVLFTYVHRDVIAETSAFQGTETLRDTLRHASEPWTFGFDPAELPRYLKARGLNLISDVDSLSYRARYMGPSGPHLTGYEFYRIALAEVAESARRSPAGHAES